MSRKWHEALQLSSVHRALFRVLVTEWKTKEEGGACRHALSSLCGQRRRESVRKEERQRPKEEGDEWDSLQNTLVWIPERIRRGREGPGREGKKQSSGDIGWCNTNEEQNRTNRVQNEERVINNFFGMKSRASVIADAIRLCIVSVKRIQIMIGEMDAKHLALGQQMNARADPKGREGSGRE